MKRSTGNKLIGWAMIILAFEILALLSAAVHTEEHGFWKTLLAANAFYFFVGLVAWIAATGLRFIERGK